jgi:hypothetical protein
MRIVPADNKNSFLSAVKRTRLSEEGSKKFTEYEIACQYRLVGLKVQTEVVYQWSVWKRYSEFEALHSTLKKVSRTTHPHMYNALHTLLALTRFALLLCKMAAV